MHTLTLSTLQLWLLVVAVLCTGVAVVLAYRARLEAVLLAFASLIIVKFSGLADIEAATLIYWGIASAIVAGIYCLLPSQVRSSIVGMAYFSTGAMAGALLGLLTNTTAGVIVAAAAGVALAALAFGRLPAGRVLDFPSKKFFNYLCAKGLPLVVIFSMLGIICLHFIQLGTQL